MYEGMSFTADIAAAKTAIHSTIPTTMNTAHTISAILPSFFVRSDAA